MPTTPCPPRGQWRLPGLKGFFSLVHLSFPCETETPSSKKDIAETGFASYRAIAQPPRASTFRSVLFHENRINEIFEREGAVSVCILLATDVKYGLVLTHALWCILHAGNLGVNFFFQDPTWPGYGPLRFGSDCVLSVYLSSVTTGPRLKYRNLCGYTILGSSHFPVWPCQAPLLEWGFPFWLVVIFCYTLIR